MTDKEFVWKGLRFVWNGRQRRWICERPAHQSGDWWLSRHSYQQSFLLKEGQEVLWDNPPEDDSQPGQFATVGWVAHFGHGDAAVRDTRDAALEAALEYALRFHHQGIAALRQVAFAPEVT